MRKLDPDRDPTTTKRIAIGNIAKVQDSEGGGPRPDAVSAPGIVSLVNIEEEKKYPERKQLRKNKMTKIEYRTLRYFLNLYCLFAINHSSFETSFNTFLDHSVFFSLEM